MRLLLADADLAGSVRLTRALKGCGIIFDQADMGEEALELARLYDYDILLINLALPDMTGIDLLRRLRASRIETPVLVLAATALSQAKAQALDAGADDCLSTPCDETELLARLRALLRRNRGFAQSTLTAGPLSLHLQSRQVDINGIPVRLTGKEFALLELLVLRKGMTLTKETFLNHLYGGMDEPEMKIIDVFVCKLRKKLAQAGADNLISTVWGRGYRLNDLEQSPRPIPTRKSGLLRALAEA